MSSFIAHDQWITRWRPRNRIYNVTMPVHHTLSRRTAEVANLSVPSESYYVLHRRVLTNVYYIIVLVVVNVKNWERSLIWATSIQSGKLLKSKFPELFRRRVWGSSHRRFFDNWRQETRFPGISRPNLGLRMMTFLIENPEDVADERKFPEFRKFPENFPLCQSPKTVDTPVRHDHYEHWPSVTHWLMDGLKIWSWLFLEKPYGTGQNCLNVFTATG